MVKVDKRGAEKWVSLLSFTGFCSGLKMAVE